uniref:Uncharacterized protein n=1 Tax=Romanomermis culicivorax TaxID=13658 RepID=A0A915KR10_ROMCU
MSASKVTHQWFQSEKAEIMVSLQVVLMGLILIGAYAFIALVDLGHCVLASVVSQYSLLILSTYTSVLCLFFCEDLRTSIKALIKHLFCKSHSSVNSL